MFFARIRRDSPEQVFMTVRNNDSVAMSVGHAVMWEFPIVASGTGTGDGYSVKYGVTTAAVQNNAALFAGIVAGRDVPSGEYGSVQVYGYHTGVYVTGYSTSPFTSAFMAATNNNSTTLQPCILKPAACFGATQGYQYLGQMAMTNASVTNMGTVTIINWAPYCPGGYVIPLGNPNGNVSISSNSTGSVKAFIKCM
jgi:hypothetical protein